MWKKIRKKNRAKKEFEKTQLTDTNVNHKETIFMTYTMVAECWLCIQL